MKQFYFVLLASIGLVGLTDGRDQRPQRIGDSCTPYNPEKTELSYDLCESVPANNYANYCDYQRRTCQPSKLRTFLYLSQLGDLHLNKFSVSAIRECLVREDFD